MRILFASLAFPFPANKGHRVRNSSLLLGLAREGHRIMLVSFAGEQDRPFLAQACECCERVVTIPPPARGRLSELAVRLDAAMERTPCGVKRFHSPEMTAALQQELREQAPDLIISDDIYMYGNLPPAPMPVLLNKHDLTFEIMERYAEHESNPLKRAYVRFEAANVRRWEIESCARADMVLACSERDRQFIQRLCPRAWVATVPNVMDVERYQSVAAGDGQTLLFIGAMDWHPNQDAVRYFAGQILPRLRQLVPGLRLVVAGRGSSGKLRASLQAPDIVFTGEVPNMAAQIAAAALCVVPLRIGSGTRLKIIEAAAMGKVTVSTSIGAEGLDFADGKEIALADTPEAFAASVAALLQAPRSRTEMGAAARRRALASYSITALRGSLREALAAASQRHHGTSCAATTTSYWSGPVPRQAGESR